MQFRLNYPQSPICHRPSWNGGDFLRGQRGKGGVVGVPILRIRIDTEHRTYTGEVLFAVASPYLGIGLGAGIRAGNVSWDPVSPHLDTDSGHPAHDHA